MGVRNISKLLSAGMTCPMQKIKDAIRDVPDFPKPGILFYDITTLLQDPVGLRDAIDSLTAPFVGQGIDLACRTIVRPGDVVAILSNGGFGGIYEKLPQRLRALGAATPVEAGGQR